MFELDPVWHNLLHCFPEMLTPALLGGLHFRIRLLALQLQYSKDGFICVQERERERERLYLCSRERESARSRERESERENSTIQFVICRSRCFVCFVCFFLLSSSEWQIFLCLSRRRLERSPRSSPQLLRTPPPLLATVRHLPRNRMLTYADVCWRMLTYAAITGDRLPADALRNTYLWYSYLPTCKYYSTSSHSERARVREGKRKKR